MVQRSREHSGDLTFGVPTVGARTPAPHCQRKIDGLDRITERRIQDFVTPPTATMGRDRTRRHHYFAIGQPPPLEGLASLVGR